MIRDAVVSFSQICGFGQNIAELSADALLECVEEYIRVCRERSISSPFTLEMEVVQDALSIQILYPDAVPLNPTEAEDYEVPEGETDIDSLDVSSLWLHLVKSKMDRVYFRRLGDARSLHLIKYRRDPGKARRHWIMGLAPKLAPGVQIEEKTRDGRGAGSPTGSGPCRSCAWIRSPFTS